MTKKIIGTNNNDSLFGTFKNDDIFGLGGGDILYGLAGKKNSMVLLVMIFYQEGKALTFFMAMQATRPYYNSDLLRISV